MEVAAIAAIGRNRELGNHNELLWHIPDDLKRFKDLSMGHPIILGRKTFDSIEKILGKPLPGRTNIVVTRDESWSRPGVVSVTSIDAALKAAQEAPGSEKIIIGGGAQIYAEALPFTTMLHLTLIADTKDADSFFPPYENSFRIVKESPPMQYRAVTYRWADYIRT